jgi:hypothetical protein
MRADRIFWLRLIQDFGLSCRQLRHEATSLARKSKEDRISDHAREAPFHLAASPSAGIGGRCIVMTSPACEVRAEILPTAGIGNVTAGAFFGSRQETRKS